MSQENVELFRAIRLEDIWSGASEFDPEATISKLAELWDPEIESDASEAPFLDLNEATGE